eukprot:Selendium_serpulae@DN6244_c0_g2_i2.p1
MSLSLQTPIPTGQGSSYHSAGSHRPSLPVHGGQEPSSVERDPYYLDIGDCLADLTKVDVRFNEDEAFLGFLSAPTRRENEHRSEKSAADAVLRRKLKSDTAVSVPLCVAVRWMNEERTNMVNTPAINDDALIALSHDPLLDLFELNRHYLCTAMKIATA